MSRLDNSLCFKIYSTSRILSRLYQPILEKLNLTFPQYIVMIALWDENEISFKELRKVLMLETGTLTPIIKKLEVMDLVKRVRNKNDERNIFIELTAKGKDMENQFSNVSESILNKVGISNDKYNEFLKETQKLFNTLNNAEDRY